MLNWDDTRVVLAVARGMTFAAAARALKLDETTIARRLARAERALGVSLFRAEDGRRVPTALGAKFLVQAERLEAEALRLEKLAAERPDEPLGSVRVAATEAIARHLLAPRVGGLLTAYPKLNLRLLTGHENVSFARWETDLAVRLARPERGDLLVRKLSDIGFARYQLQGDGRLERTSSPSRRWLGYHEDLEHLPEARFVSTRLDGREPVFRSNDLDTLAAAAGGGAGVACLPLFVAESMGAGAKGAGAKGAGVSGARVRPDLTREAWLLMRPELRDDSAVRAVADWIVAVFQEFQDRMSGRES